MSTRLGDLVESLGGELIGDPDIAITGIAPLEAASASHITFLSNPRLRSGAAQTRASALILSAKDHSEIGGAYTGAVVLTDNPYAYYARVAQFFAERSAPPPKPGIHPSAVIDASAKIAATAVIGPNVTIDAGVVIGEHCIIGAGCVIGKSASLGEGTVLHPNVSFLADCHIGARGVIQSGAVIGGDGFGFANDKGRWIKIPQTGGVRLGDDVEIGANTTIDRGALDDTVIGNGVKLDNQIQIAHNCVIGENTAMAGCVGVAGSAKIGRNCTFGGAAMVLGHLSIADNVHISSGSLVSRSIAEPGQYTGFYPLAKNADWEKTAAVVRQLDTMRDRIRELEKIVRQLTDKNSSSS
ncbi:MAG: UDP-3-O-(3-hydroxymyristoyl)glucosamine N-acyltransferase [Pseudomonadota bacterium]|jgi:UDP-3-O-[3-hydroxymyristoyl] glucosamine N-acyltransferase|nr:UDP-3-O-(3-hydroxymyristoyl)glucosamine N-acyltransferase [Oxalobacteraceae bacterium]